MRIVIRESEVHGNIRAPSSKSMTHRGVFCSALASGKSKIDNPLSSDDTIASLKAIQALGISVDQKEESWHIKGEGLKAPVDAIDCVESGTTLRFLTGICALVDGVSILRGKPSLSKRPIKPLLDALSQLGVQFEYENSVLPIKIHGKGGFDGNEVTIRGDISSQFVSSLLLIAPFANEHLQIKITTKIESAPYVALTLDSLKSYGINVEILNESREFLVKRQEYKPNNFQVEGDWSSGAYLIAAGTMFGKTKIENLNKNSSQADSEIIGILSKMGASLQLKESSVIAEKSILKGIEKDLTDSPDLFPLIAVLCSVAEGKSKLTGLKRLRIKESDRINAMQEGLERMGIKTRFYDDSMIVHGGSPTGAKIYPHNDHRIAMAFGILGLAAEGETTILDAECVSKSYPNFWNDLEFLGAQIGVIKDG